MLARVRGSARPPRAPRPTAARPPRSSRMSAKPRMALSGLRSSWLTAARNAARSRSAARTRVEVALVARLRRGEAIDERVERDGEARRPRPSCAPARPRPSAPSARGPCRARARRRTRRPCWRRAPRRTRRPPRRRRAASSGRRAHAASAGAASGALGSRTNATSTWADGEPRVAARWLAKRARPRPGDGLARRDSRTTRRSAALIRHAQARVEHHVPFARDDDELGPGLARGELHQPRATRSWEAARGARRASTREARRARPRARRWPSRGSTTPKSRWPRRRRGPRGSRSQGRAAGAARRGRCAETSGPFERWCGKRRRR